MWLTSPVRRPTIAAIALVAALGAPASIALAQDDAGLAGLPEAAELATDGRAVEGILTEVGLDAAWRSATGLGPVARATRVEYRGDEGDSVALMLATSAELGSVSDQHAGVVRDLREVALELNEARETERAREIDRNRADAHFRGTHALMQAVALDLFSGSDPASDALLGLDGAALTVAQRTHKLTKDTLDEMVERRRAAEAALQAAIEAHEASQRRRLELEQRRGELSADAVVLASRSRELENAARELLPIAAAAFSLAQVPREARLTPRALDAYIAAERAMTELQPGCGISWRTVAAVGAVEGAHGAYAGRWLDMSGKSDTDIVGIALDGATVDNLGETVASIPDTDNGRYDGDTVYDRAVGPMQFIPDTWARWGRDGDGDGVMDPHDIDDATVAAAAYLCNYGSLRSWDTWNVAVFGYNHSPAYVNAVKATLDRVLQIRLPDVDEADGLRPPQPAGVWVALPVPDPENPEGENPEGEQPPAGAEPVSAGP